MKMNQNRLAVLLLSAALLFIAGGASASEAFAPLAQTTADAEGLMKASEPLGSAFTYQGSLSDAGQPANGSYNFRFYLWADQAKTRLLGTVPNTGTMAVPVNDGLFSVQLDFGSQMWNGAARWLEIEVNGTTLTPLQPVTGTPYALSLLPGATISSTIPGGMLNLTNTGGDGLVVNQAERGIVLESIRGDGLRIEHADGDGIFVCSTGNQNDCTPHGANSGVEIANAQGRGVHISEAQYGVWIGSVSQYGVWVEDSNASGLRVDHSNNYGLYICATGSETACIPLGGARHGIGIGRVEGDGINIERAGSDGLFVDRATQHGVAVNSAGNDGVNIFSASGDGVSVGIVGGDGVVVGSPGNNGVYVANAGIDGVLINSAADDGVQVTSAWNDGVYVSSAGDNAIEARTNNNSETILARNVATTDDSDAIKAITYSYYGEAVEAINAAGSGGIIFLGCSDAACVDREFVVRNNGNVTADGTFTGGGADYADMMAVSGDAAAYSPGDVLVIGPDGQLTHATQPNATNVIGIYSTNPAFVGDPRGTREYQTASGFNPESDEVSESDLHNLVEVDAIDNLVPVALVGIVPCKVSAENGPIQPGDLLTTSNLPGHAMKASAVVINGVEFYAPGTIIGKAMEPLESGEGLIQVLVTLQ